MQHQSIHWSLIFRTLCIVLLPLSTSVAQQRLDLGVVFGPETNHVVSEPRESDLLRSQTTGESGTAVGFIAGAYLEYEVVSGLFLRGGLNYTRKRYNYSVTRGLPEQGNLDFGQNRVVYTAIEIPVAVLYRFLYRPNNDRFYVGLGGVVNRWLGDPQIETDFALGSSNRSYIDEAKQSGKFFVGYDRYISSRFVLGIEPYVSYSPTRFLFETETISENRIQGGVAIRIRFDN